MSGFGIRETPTTSETDTLIPPNRQDVNEDEIRDRYDIVSEIAFALKTCGFILIRSG